MYRLVKGQPKGFFLLFFTELWERFGFYTLQTILVPDHANFHGLGCVKALLGASQVEALYT